MTDKLDMSIQYGAPPERLSMAVCVGPLSVQLIHALYDGDFAYLQITNERSGLSAWCRIPIEVALPIDSLLTRTLPNQGVNDL